MPLLHWLTREEDIHRAAHAPYRLLEEAPDLSHGDRDTGNMLIQGDNLDALKALLPYYAGKVKCVFIDPPYNTRSAFEHYNDNLEHSQWLAMIYPRLELLRKLLSEDGSIWVSIDDNEGHYLKVVMDEVFGRSNFIANVVWQKKFSPQNDAKWLSDMHDHVLVFAKNKMDWRPNLLPRSFKQEKNFKNPDNDPRGSWASADYTCAKSKDERPNLYYPIRNPFTGKDLWPKPTRVWAFDQLATKENEKNGLLWWGINGDNPVPRLKKFPHDVRQGTVPGTVWLHQDVGNNQDARREVLNFNQENPFSTPKPEALINHILSIATKENDLILDSFLGSGTTAAVAHKMGRRYIGIEMGEHAVTHCAPRLRKVIEGEQGGISEAVDWKGGGGFRFYRLGDPVFDEAGHISPGIRFAPLAAHVWFIETGVPFPGGAESPLLGIHDGTAYYLLYNGILGDKRPNGGNVLTAKVLAALPPFDGPKVIFGEGCRMSAERLENERITFRQIPYEIKAR